MNDFASATAFPPASSESWRALVDKDLGGAPFERKLMTHTYEGLLLKPLYTDADWPHAAERSGMSGMAPWTRGSRPLGTALAGWETWQERREVDPTALNAALLEDLAGGMSGVVLRFDAGARSGLDPDEGGGLSGADGCMLYTLDDLGVAMHGVHLEMVTVALECGAAFVPGAALLAALWERNGVTPGQARGAFNADPLAVLARDGHLPYALHEGLAAMSDLAVWTAAKYPGVTSVRVGTAPYHHAGATATQDLAFALATGVEYLRALTGAGMSVDAAATQMRFSFAVGCGVFLATAKLRGARRVWARVLGACGASPEHRGMRMHVRASKRVLATRDPWVNMLRNTACVLAGGLGGADAIGSEPFDAPLGAASELGRRVARNTHHVLMDECQVHRVCDPAGGSWYIERLTDELCAKAWVIFQAIESRGGMSRVLQSGWVSEQIDSAFKPRARNLATRKDAVLGVSEFPNLGEERPMAPTPDVAGLRAAARQRVIAARAKAAPVNHHDRARVDRAVYLAGAGETIGQIMRGTMDGPRRAAVLPCAIAVHPFAEAFEHLRDHSDEYLAQCGHRPRVFLASMGSAGEHLARTNFVRNLFEAGGFEVLGGAGYRSIETACEEFAVAGAGIAVICGSDERSPALIPELAPALRRAGAETVIAAGNPGEREATYRAAGVNHFVFVKCDVVSLLRDLLTAEGVPA